jgi:hypothetical protein
VAALLKNNLGCRLNFAENILRFNDDRVAVYATGNFDYISFT